MIKKIKRKDISFLEEIYRVSKKHNGSPISIATWVGCELLAMECKKRNITYKDLL
jgi:hypothetical protein